MMPPQAAGASDDRGSPAAGNHTVLDAMLEAAFSGHRSSHSRAEGPASARPPRGPGSGRSQRGSAQSASPRPQRWRPVDAVRLAKHELAQGEAHAATLPAKARLGTVEVPAPSLHEGFYDFAAAVVKPQPSARNYALQLREQLDEKLTSVRRTDLAKRSARMGAGNGADNEGAPAAQKKAILIAGERSCREIDICVDTVEQYIKDTSTDSKERNSLLERLRTVSEDALKHLLTLLKTCAKDIEDAEKNKLDLEISLAAVEEDNGGLRHVVQQMLSTESNLQTSNQSLQKEVDELRKNLKQSGQRIIDLNNELESTRAELEALRDEQARGRPTCDRCVSPMMGFSTFVMSTDQVPAPVATDMLTNDSSGWVKQEGLSSLSGFKQEASAKTDEKIRRKTFSTQNTNPIMVANVANMFRQSARLSTAFMSPEEQSITIRDMHAPRSKGGPASRHGSRSAMSSPMPPVASRSTSPDTQLSSLEKAPPQEMPMARAASTGAGREAHSVRGESIAVVSGLQTLASNIAPSPSPMPHDAPDLMGSRRSSLSQDDNIVIQDLAPSVLATSFSELLPFVDFATLDPGLERSQADAIAQSQEHLEKHMVMLQDDYQREVGQNEELQCSVDTALERILVWVQAVHDSLQDLASNAVQQDVNALTTLRNAVQWLAKHPCKEWTDKPGKLEEVLDDHEHELRAFLEADRPNDSEVEELRRSIIQQRQRVQELSDQLLEARSAGPGGRSGRRVGAPGAVSRRVSSLAGTGEPPPVMHAAVQCDLQLPTAEAPRPAKPASYPVQHTERLEQKDAAEASSLPATARTPSESPQSPDTEIVSNSNHSSGGSGTYGAQANRRTADEETDEDSSSAMGASGAQRTSGGAVQLMGHEAKKMRLLRSPFVEGIDFLLVPAAGHVMLSVPGSAEEAHQIDENKLLGLKQLHAVLNDLYTTKRADDLRRDKVQEERRPLYIVLQEVMRRSHGVKKVVHQKSWLLIESMAHYAGTDKKSAFCSDFLDGTRDLDELSFYLYSLKVLTASIADDSKAFPTARLPDGFVSYSRAQALAEMLFGDLPKALSVVRAEFEKCARLDRQAEELATHFFLTGIASEEAAMASAYCLPVENVAEILMEGWRMCALLMDKGIPNFSWRKNVLAFLQTDVCHRGWLDPHQVVEAENGRLQIVPAPGAESIRIEERTSLGAFVFRALQRSELEQRQAARVATLTQHGLLNPTNEKAEKRTAPQRPHALLPAAAARKKAQKKAAELCMQVGNAAFDSVKKTLEVYLKWMQHSEELRDLTAYRSVKAQIYGFQQACGHQNVNVGLHHLRSLLILLLAHQFDVQFQQEDLSPQHLDWELRCLLHVLRESWKHGAAAGGDPEFAKELAGEEGREPAAVEDYDH